MFLPSTMYCIQENKNNEIKFNKEWGITIISNFRNKNTSNKKILGERKDNLKELPKKTIRKEESHDYIKSHTRFEQRIKPVCKCIWL